MFCMLCCSLLVQFDLMVCFVAEEVLHVVFFMLGFILQMLLSQ